VLLVPTEIVDANDVFVREIARGPGFGEKALFGFFVLACRVGQDLDRHLTADHSIHGAVDMRHAAAEKFLQFVFAETRWKLDQVTRKCLGMK